MASQLGRNTITEAVRIRRETDDIMSALWIVFALFGAVAFFAILFGGLFLGTSSAGRTGLFGGAIVGFVVGIVVAIILFVLPWYRLIKRRNGHFRRDRMLREGLINYVRGLAAERGIESKMNIELATMTSIHSESKGEEDEKSPVLWVVSSIITFGLHGMWVGHVVCE